MTAVAVASIADAPGVSTLCVGLASTWPSADERTGAAMVVEADPDGGRLGSRLGVGVEPGLMSLALASRSTPLDVVDVVDASAAIGEWLLLPAPPSAEQTHSALTYSATSLATVIAAHPDRGWVLDLGRLSPRSPAFPLAVKADELLLVARGDLAAIQLLPTRLAALRGAGCRRLSIVIVGPTPWPLVEVADFAATDVAAQLPFVAGAGGVASLSARRWRGWWETVGDLAALLAGRALEAIG